MPMYLLCPTDVVLCPAAMRSKDRAFSQGASSLNNCQIFNSKNTALWFGRLFWDRLRRKMWKQILCLKKPVKGLWFYCCCCCCFVVSTGIKWQVAANLQMVDSPHWALVWGWLLNSLCTCPHYQPQNPGWLFRGKDSLLWFLSWKTSSGWEFSMPAKTPSMCMPKWW